MRTPNRETAAWQLVYKYQREERWAENTPVQEQALSDRAGKAEHIWHRAIRGNQELADKLAVELAEFTSELVYDSTKTPAEVFYQLATAVVKAGGVLPDAQPRRPRGE